MGFLPRLVSFWMNLGVEPSGGVFTLSSDEGRKRPEDLLSKTEDSFMDLIWTAAIALIPLSMFAALLAKPQPVKVAATARKVHR